LTARAAPRRWGSSPPRAGRGTAGNTTPRSPHAARCRTSRSAPARGAGSGGRCNGRSCESPPSRPSGASRARERAWASFSVRVRQCEARRPPAGRPAVHLEARHPTQRQRDVLLAVGAEEVHDEATARAVVLERLLAARMPYRAVRPHEGGGDGESAHARFGLFVAPHPDSFLLLLLQHMGSKIRSMEGGIVTFQCSRYLPRMPGKHR